MNNIDLKSIGTKFEPLLKHLIRYRIIIFIVLIMSTYSLLVFRINVLTNKQPDDSTVTTQLQAVNPPKLDPNIITKILQLQDNSVEVKALFNQARENPFQE